MEVREKGKDSLLVWSILLTVPSAWAHTHSLHLLDANTRRKCWGEGLQRPNLTLLLVSLFSSYKGLSQSRKLLVSFLMGLGRFLSWPPSSQFTFPTPLTLVQWFGMPPIFCSSMLKHCRGKWNSRQPTIFFL